MNGVAIFTAVLLLIGGASVAPPAGPSDLRVDVVHFAGHATERWWFFTVEPDRTAERKGGPADARLQISVETQRELVTVVEDNRFFDLPAEIGGACVDCPFCHIQVTLGGRSHGVTVGSSESLPDGSLSDATLRVSKVWEAIRQAAGGDALASDCL